MRLANALMLVLATAFGSLAIWSCTVEESQAPRKKTIAIDGSSTVYPITQAAAEEFMKAHDDVDIVVQLSGTGGGFKSFVKGETDINDASRPIKPGEIEACNENGIEYIELKVAIDGISVVVHPDNDWCKSLTVAQLKKIWEPGSKVKLWSDIDPSWPEEEMTLYGPDTDSGTFDYFTEEICGETKASRTDYTANSSDNFLVRGVSSDPHALGYFGFAYYNQNTEKVSAVPIAKDTSSEPVMPKMDTILSGEYTPLSRPLFLYVNKASLKKPHLAEFLKYYLGDDGQALVENVGYVRVDPETLDKSRGTLNAALDELE